MKNWLRQHAFAVESALSHVRRTPFSFTLNGVVVAIALALPLAGLTILENVRPMSEHLTIDPEISLFLKMNLAHEDALSLEPSIRNILEKNKKSAKISFVSREKALKALKQRNGLPDVIATLGSNPLPDGYVIKLDSFKNAADAMRIDEIAGELRALPGVESAQLDSAWIKRLAALLNILRMTLLFLATTLGVVVIAVVFNTIRLQVMTQLDEISVSRLLGATDVFIRRPFFYTGALLGLCSGTIALGAVALALSPLNATIADFAHLYASQFQLVPLSIAASSLLLVISGLLGLAGAWLSVKRHLAPISS